MKCLSVISSITLYSLIVVVHPQVSLLAPKKEVIVPATDVARLKI